MNNSTIKATILADSISYSGKRITSFELEMPRFIWAEVLTHRLFSRNAASSRAIPIKKIIEQIRQSPAQPVMWGANQPGMQSTQQLWGKRRWAAQKIWNLAAYSSTIFTSILGQLGLHKQYANRVSEYAQTYKVVLTATEFDNFFHLRCHADAQPEIKALADAMYSAMKESTPIQLAEGEWHLPYVITTKDETGIHYLSNNLEELTLDQAIKVSASCCAQVSYRLLDTSIDKAELIYKRLVDSTPVHASPFEHQATPMPKEVLTHTGLIEGITHIDREGNYWSGNFQAWIQNRQLIPNNYCDSYEN